jgi:integration host factor subunit beta
MTRSQLIEAIAHRLGVEHAVAEGVVRVVFDAMSDALTRGDGIEVRGFGSFRIRTHGPYRGRNPRNGQTVDVGPKKLPFFKVGKPLRARIQASGRRSAERLAHDSGGE